MLWKGTRSIAEDLLQSVSDGLSDNGDIHCFSST